ncbi:MAG: glycogen debranching protein GlgX [Candidatus Ancillula trichonymphae]|jgi:glycogen operon protein|nr:glycogen debranching protein GlgX [Candidatus Ancillula trichonymphae]
MTLQRYARELGVRFSGDGVDVALFAPDATRVEFCVLNQAGNAWIEHGVDLEGPNYGIWDKHISGIGAGQHYGFRVHGPWDPKNGFYFNSNKLLVDPYARAVYGDYRYGEATLGYESFLDADNTYKPKLLDKKMMPSQTNSLPFVPHSVILHDLDSVHPPVFHPHIPWSKTVIYEAHVVGLTKNATWLPEHMRGTYAGLANSKTIEYLKDLGVSTIELLPIHSAVSEAHLIMSDLTNYWGYSTLSYFAPNPDYATENARNYGPGAVVDEVRGMIHLLHEAGIEVILDVVYNHTCEESNAGSTLSYRGIANRNYYVHSLKKPGELVDTTGCGNSLNFREPHVVRLALDSLRYWASQIGVDGFRFDLMTTTARGENGFTKEHPFLVSMKNDPVLGNLKIIAEPWDLGPFGWQTGKFGFPYSEWNDSFRDDVRTFWVKDQGRMKLGWAVSSSQSFATRLSGSSDIFSSDPFENLRGPLASINYITAHDGFTLRDLVSYDQKHNDANMENNNDGATENNSYNHGAEGETDDLSINSNRRKTIRNTLGTLLLSTGVPMLTAGDEIGRTQRGNNNAYCQNNETSWLNWELEKWQSELLRTTKHLIWIRQTYPALRQNKFFTGEKKHELDDFVDLSWLQANSFPFSMNDWQNSDNRTFQAVFAAPNNGEENSDVDILIIFNGKDRSSDVVLPAVRKWHRLWNSRGELPRKFDMSSNNNVKVGAFSMQVFAGKGG